MPICGPTNTIPSCTATPSVGFGSENFGFGGALGIGGSGSLGSGRGYEGTIPAASLRVLPGVPVDGITQIPPSEAVIQPPPSVVIIPGCILSSSTQAVEAGGYYPSAVPGYGRGFGYGGFGFSYRSSFLGRH